MKRFVFLLLLVLPLHVWAVDTVRLDVKHLWMSYSENELVPFNGGNTAYLPVSECKGDSLEISSKYPFAVFLNGRLLENNVRQFHSSILTLKKFWGETAVISIFSSSGVDEVAGYVLQISQEDSFATKKSIASNFIIMAGFFLAGYFIVLLRTQPSLTFAYFNVPRIFGVRFSDEKQNLRITSVSNLFFYLFSSSLAAVVLFVFVQSSDLISLDVAKSLGEVVVLIGIVFSLFLFKALLLKGLAMLFRLEDFSSSQFQDYPKVWLISFGFCALLLTILAMFNVTWSSWISTLEYFVAITHLVFVVAIFMKLLARGGFTTFHLFSYLCATEIIPLIILFNIYFF